MATGPRDRRPDGDDVAVLDVAHLRAHVAGGQDVREEQHLLVAEVALDTDRADVGERHPGVLACAPAKPPVRCE
jgi:hypothetical protein